MREAWGRLLAFLKLSRLPFLTPGLAPFTAGVLLGYLITGSIPYPILLVLSYIGLSLIMLATYYSNEYFDFEGDILNREFNRFSGGSRVLPEGLLPRTVGFKAFTASLVILASALLYYLIAYYAVRPLLLILALIGVFAGVFYTTPPIRWAYRGVGELWIAFAYGWLTVASGYYIVTGLLDLNTILLALPPAFTVFIVILINEFPDFKADMAVGKRNLVVRLGLDRARFVYGVGLLGYIVSVIIAGFTIAGLPGLLVSLATIPLPLKLIYMVVKRRAYRDRKVLEKICGLTIVLNAISAYPPLVGLILCGVL